MQEAGYITFISDRKKCVINSSTILYIIVVGKNTEIHVSGGIVYNTRISLGKLEEELGDGFVRVHRGCIVSAKAIHNITNQINLSNGESLEYTLRKKKSIIEQVVQCKKSVIDSFSEEGIPATEAQYFKYYKSFDKLPFAFTDIEMVFNEEKHAIDWIFRYGNNALAKLEKMPLDRLIGSSFGGLFANMDSKWLRTYESATLYGQTLEMIDYSPEIDTYLKVICFPTFKGHCGCILFNISEIEYVQNSTESQNALMLYMGKFLHS